MREEKKINTQLFTVRGIKDKFCLTLLWFVWLSCFYKPVWKIIISNGSSECNIYKIS